MKSINLQRTESLLMELIPEALSELSDHRISTIAVTGVDCKNGKYHAKVLIDLTDYDEQEKRIIIKLLHNANGRIKSYCLAATGWYKCPNFTFVEDKSIQYNNNIESLFAKISKDKDQ